MNIDNLVIEVTRQCQIECFHCLRGDKENMTLRVEYLDALLSTVEYISCITFTGGEPSLHPEIIDYALNVCRANKVEVGNFYIATNGVSLPDAFLLICLHWYLYCSDNELSSVVVSRDGFHYEQEDAHKLKAFSFSGETDVEQKYCINEGRWKENRNLGRKLTPDTFEIEDGDIREGNLYLNCEGNLIAGRDWSYKSQRKKENIICAVKEDTDVLEAVKTYMKRKG